MFKLNRVHLMVATAVPISIVLFWAFLVSFRTRPPAPAKAVRETPESRRASEPDETKERRRVAITPEQFDAMGRLLDEFGDGYRYELIDDDTLRDPRLSARFDSIFLTCADPAGRADDSTLSEGLRKYVIQGGTLYASDLWYDTIAAAFPERVDRLSVSQGLRQKVRARMIAPELRDVVGAEVPLNFRLDGWRTAAFGGDDVSVLLSGPLRTNAGVEIDAPLLVKFPFEKGTVIFTSFHNEKDNSDAEVKLLRYLVLMTMTAGVESRVKSTLADGGFVVRDVFAMGAAPDAPPVKRVFEHAKPGALRVRLGFDQPGAEMRLDLVAPDGTRTTRRGNSTLAIDLPNAGPGRWQYSAAAEDVPYPEFPCVLMVATEGVSSHPSGGQMNPLVAENRDNVTFREIFLGGQNEKAAARPLKIAVTTPKFDDMGRLLRALGDGYRFDEVMDDALLREQAFDAYDIVFLTCGGWPAAWGVTEGGETVREGITLGEMQPEIREKVGATLRRFVTRGGTLYASDLRSELVDYAFPDRIPSSQLNLAPLGALDDAERAWLKLIAPTARVGTVAETIRGAKLDKTLDSKFDRILAAVETTNLVELRDAPARAGFEERVRSRLSAFGVDASEKDSATIARILETRNVTIRDSFRARARSKVARSARQIAEAEVRLKELRKTIIKAEDGAGEQTVTARVEDSGLRESLGPTLELHFPDNSWKPGLFSGNDVKVLMMGEYRTVSGDRNEAPLLVKFREGKGTVIFTSFHNEEQNSEKELELLRCLVFSAVTAKQDALAQQSMLSGGFSPVKQSQLNHGAGHASVTKVYKSSDAGPLRFALTFSGSGAKLRLTLIAPNGQKYANEVDSTLLVEATGAPAGTWTYTVEALKVPYENFPYNVSIGKGSAGSGR